MSAGTEVVRAARTNVYNIQYTTTDWPGKQYNNLPENPGENPAFVGKLAERIKGEEKFANTPLLHYTKVV